MYADSIESKVKLEFSKVFKRSDYSLFKYLVDEYFVLTSTLKIKDLKFKGDKNLLIRNIQKRLHFGIAEELLIKSFYLKCGYYINKSYSRKSVICRFNDSTESDINPNETYTFNQSIQNKEL